MEWPKEYEKAEAEGRSGTELPVKAQKPYAAYFHGFLPLLPIFPQVLRAQELKDC